MKITKFSPEKYIRENAKKFPTEVCLIADLYKIKGLTSCFIIKKQPSGKFMFANFLVDRLCLGVKDTIVNCNYFESDLKNIIYEMAVSQCDFEEVTEIYFNNLIFGAIDYAKELGFNTPKDFALAECFLNENLVNDDIDDIEMGWDSKPFFISGPFDDEKRILAKLNASVGEGNYKYVTKANNFF